MSEGFEEGWFGNPQALLFPITSCVTFWHYLLRMVTILGKPGLYL